MSFEFESGIQVEGLNITGIRNIQGKLMLIQLDECTVTYEGEQLFSPEQGVFNMAIGTKVLSAYAGAADHNSFPNLYNVSKTKTIRYKKSDFEIKKEQEYQKIRDLRESKSYSNQSLESIFELVQKEYPNEWLILIEILEISENQYLTRGVKSHLLEISARNENLSELISSGIAISSKAISI